MHKKLLTILTVSFLFVASILILMFATLNKTTKQPQLPIPTSIPDIYTSPIPTVSASVRVLSSKPDAGAVDVAVDIADIRILFNSPQKPEQFKMFLGDIGRVMGGVALLLIAAEGIVRASFFFAQTFQISLALI